MADTSRRRQNGLQRHGAAAAEQGRSAAAEAGRRGGELAAETIRRGGEAGVEAAAQLEAVVEEIDRSLARAARGRAEDVRRLTAPAAAEDGGGIPEMQRAVAGLVEGVLRINLRAAEEMFRLADPGPVVELQRHIARECLGALVEGQAALLRAARRAAEEARRSIERQLERRREGGGRRVADVMSRAMRVVGPEDTVQQAARLMREEDSGVLPVGEDGRLIGTVTDRDLALRLAAEGRDPARTRVREVMTPGAHCVFEDEDPGRAAEGMAG